MEYFLVHRIEIFIVIKYIFLKIWEPKRRLGVVNGRRLRVNAHLNPY
jgi:hypothetical protein